MKKRFYIRILALWLSLVVFVSYSPMNCVNPQTAALPTGYVVLDSDPKRRK